MLILASDTTGSAVSAALWQDGRILAECALCNGLAHSQTFMPLLVDLLKQGGRTIKAVDLFAVTVGPGSFTGIRIGISAVKAMAYATGKPAVGVSTLEAMAWPFHACRRTLVCPMLDARNERVFAGAWLDGRPVIAECGGPAGQFVDQVLNLAGDSSTGCSVLLTGCRLPAALAARLQSDERIGTAPALTWQARAAAVAELAAEAAAAGKAESPQHLQANYLAMTSAERLLIERNA